MIDVSKLENVRLRGDKLIARCPACAEAGADKSGNHLYIADAGKGPFACIANAGDSGAAHRKRIWTLVGMRENESRLTATPPVARPTTPQITNRIPSLRPLTEAEMTCISKTRGWHSTDGLKALSDRGVLHGGPVWDNGVYWPAWIACDSSRRNADARRVDGEMWKGIGAKAKALTAGSRGWPVGADSIAGRELVVVCEGMPDFAAALLVAAWEGLPVEKVAPVCMTGAGNSIHPDALGLFAGKRIRIAVHHDPQGQGLAAATNWAIQLHRAGATTVDGFNFSGLVKSDGQQVKDLADFATLLGIGANRPDLTQGARVFAGIAIS